MKTKSIFSVWTLTAMLSMTLTACVTDDSSEGGNTIPQLNVKGADSDEMTTYNFYLGNDCVISPDITYSGGNEENLKYSWKIGTMANGLMGKLEEVSNERDLKYTFTSGGTYYAHFTVSDGLVGKAVNYRININRTFEEGYLLTSTDADGKGNLAFVKILTPEEVAEGQKQVVIEHSLEIHKVEEETGLRVVGAMYHLEDGRVDFI